jgi:hypothetical protein
MFIITVYNACRLLARIVEEDMRLEGLLVNRDKSDNELLHERLHLGFIFDLAKGLFKVPPTRWESLRDDANVIIAAKGVRVQARTLASLMGTIFSMKLAWGLITQLYTRNLYRIPNSVASLNCWVTINDEALDKLLFGKDLPCLRFESDI